MAGWIKIHRSLLDHPIARDAVALALWVRLIARAAHEPKQIKWGKSFRQIERGQLFFTIREMAEQSGLSVKQVRRILETLKMGTMIGTEQGTHGTIVTILNYSKYQNKRESKGTHEGTHEGTPRAHQGHTKGTPKSEKQPPEQDNTEEKQPPKSIIGNKGLKEEKKRRREEDISAPVSVAVPEPANAGRVLIAHYCDEWKAKYGTHPPINGQAAGACNQILKAIGLERAKQYVSAYLMMADAWFLTKHHDLPTLGANLNKVASFLAHGRAITSTTARQMELVAENDALIERYRTKNASQEDAI